MLNLWLIIYLIMSLYIFKAFGLSTELKGHNFQIQSLTGLPNDTYLIVSVYSTQLGCIMKCANIINCQIVSYSEDRICSLFSLEALFQLIYSINSNVYIKQTYLSVYLNEFNNYWLGSSDGVDVISGANLFDGVNVTQTSNKNGKPFLAFLFDYGYYKVPPGVYFNGDFTVSAWIKMGRYGHNPRLIDFGNSQRDGVSISLANTYSNEVRVFITNGRNLSAIRSKSDLRTGIWDHLTVTLKESTGYIYINGIFDTSGPLNIPSNVIRYNNYIGRSNWFPIDPDVSAAISDIKIFNRALDQSEIIFNLNQK